MISVPMKHGNVSRLTQTSNHLLVSLAQVRQVSPDQRPVLPVSPVGEITAHIQTGRLDVIVEIQE